MVSFNVINSKWKLWHPILSMFLLIERMLGWLLNLLIAVKTFLRANNTWFCGDILVTQIKNYITEVVIKYFSYLKILSYGFSIFCQTHYMSKRNLVWKDWLDYFPKIFIISNLPWKILLSCHANRRNINCVVFHNHSLTVHFRPSETYSLILI